MISSDQNNATGTPGVEQKSYRVGTLAYTTIELARIMAWMFLGYFCLQLMEELPTALVPLQLREVSASDALIGFLTGSLPAVLGIFLNPFVGVQSDRYRGKLGRRRPFLIWATPFVFISLAGLGFAEPASRALSDLLHCTSPQWVRIGWIGGFMMLFVVSNTYVLQVYQFLFVDVIPSAVMGRFIGYYRACGALGWFCFHYFLYGKAETHMTSIYLLAACMYAVSFYLLIWQVREGEYPPPHPRSASGVLAFGRSFFRECFGHPFYWKTYSLSFFFWSAVVPLWAFAVFFGTKPGGGLTGYAPTIGMTLDQFGKLRGLGALVSVPVYFAIGPLVDRFHPLRVCMVGLALCVAAFLSCFLFADGPTSFRVCWIGIMIAWAAYMGPFGAVLPRLMERARYGQFVSANQIFGFCGVMFSPVLCGWLISSLHNYRYLFAWSGGCATIGLLMCYLVYRDWLRFGGDASYAPPTTS
jgi:hypothetical protein